MSTPQSHRVPEVPSESTATALLPHRPRSMPPTCTPRHAARSEQSRPIPTLLGRTRKRRWKEGGTHRTKRLMSAESELGTLPVSSFLLSQLHTRSGLGRSAVLRRTHSNHVPLQYPRTVPHREGVPLEYSSVTSRARVPSESTATALLPHCPRSMPPTCTPRHAARSEQSRPIRPSSAARAARRGQAQCFKLGERGERARHTHRQRIVVEVAAHPKRTRPLGGATPHPQQR